MLLTLICGVELCPTCSLQRPEIVRRIQNPLKTFLIPIISFHFGPWSLLISHFKVPGTFYTLVEGLLNNSPFQWQFVNKRRHLDYANINNKRPQGSVLECVWKKRQVATRTSLFWRGHFELQKVKTWKKFQ